MLVELGGLTAAKVASAPPKELELVDKEITDVIKVLTDELTALEQVNFPVKGHIAKSSFGGGEPSPVLARHHARAHGVVVDMLTDLKSDLTNFQLAIQEAQKLLRRKDEEAAADIQVLLGRTQGLDMGKWALVNAQHEHVNDQATDTPPAPGTEEG